MSKQQKYKIPDEYFFRLHHVRPRFKNDVEEVLLYVATSISEMEVLPEKEFNDALNKVLFGFKKTLLPLKKLLIIGELKFQLCLLLFKKKTNIFNLVKWQSDLQTINIWTSSLITSFTHSNIRADI